MKKGEIMTHDHDFEFENNLQVGQPAPVWGNLQAYHNGEYHRVSLEDYKDKWLVLFFYPRDFTFICPTEIEEFGKMYEDFKKLNCEIVASSTDSEYVHKAWFETDSRLKNVSYPIIADTTQELAEMYQVLDTDGSSQRGTFIVDPEGILKFMLVSADSVGRNIAETLRVVEALQTGEKCPANWTHGGTTLGKI